MSKNKHKNDYICDDRENSREIAEFIISMTDDEFDEYMIKNFGRTVPREEIYGE